MTDPPSSSCVQSSCVRRLLNPSPPHKRKRKPAGTPDPDAEVVALSPKTLMESDRYVCEICGQGFQRDQNLQMHRRRHKVPWKLVKRVEPEARKLVYVCPEPACLHHHPSHALGDLVGIKKHYRRKHSSLKQWACGRCAKAYAVHSDFKAHLKTCGTRGHSCDCGRVFSRVESFIEHQNACAARGSRGDGRIASSAQPQTATMPATADAVMAESPPITTPSNTKAASSSHLLGMININMPPILGGEAEYQDCSTILNVEPMQSHAMMSSNGAVAASMAGTIIAIPHIQSHDEYTGCWEAAEQPQIPSVESSVVNERLDKTKHQFLPMSMRLKTDDEHLQPLQLASSQSSATTCNRPREVINMMARDITKSCNEVLLISGASADDGPADVPSCKLQLSIGLSQDDHESSNMSCCGIRASSPVADLSCSTPALPSQEVSDIFHPGKPYYAKASTVPSPHRSRGQPMQDYFQFNSTPLISSNYPFEDSSPEALSICPAPEAARLSISSGSSGKILLQMVQEKLLTSSCNHLSVASYFVDQKVGSERENPRLSGSNDEHIINFLQVEYLQGSSRSSMPMGSVEGACSNHIGGTMRAEAAEKLLNQAREKLRRASAEKLEAEKAWKKARRESDLAEAELASAKRMAHLLIISDQNTPTMPFCNDCASCSAPL